MSSDTHDDGDRPIRPDSVSGVDGPEEALVDPTTPADRPAPGGGSASIYPDGPGSGVFADDDHVETGAGGPASPYPDGPVGRGGAGSAHADEWGHDESYALAGRARYDAGLALAPQQVRDTYAPVQFDPHTEFEPPEDLPPWYEDEYYDDRDWERLPRGTSTLFRVGLFVAGLAVVLVIAGSFVKGWVDEQLDPPGDPGEEVVIDIPVGAATNDIVRILTDEGIVANSTVFRYYLQYKDAGDFQAGEYTFRTNSAVWEAREVLEGGPRIPQTLSVLVVEGLTVDEMQASLLESMPEFDPLELADAVTATRRPTLFEDALLTTTEGYFFPATYDISEDAAADEAQLLSRMVDTFDAVADEVGLGRARRRVGVSPYQALIVASLIEEEAKVDDDRAKIARVIYNRLEAGWTLGIDATVVYALGGDRELSQSDLEVDSPYNTRLYPGLPPGPIAAPGRASLEAALNPEPGDWMYYVLTDENGPGTHTFAVTEQEFNAAVAICVERDLGCG